MSVNNKRKLTAEHVPNTAHRKRRRNRSPQPSSHATPTLAGTRGSPITQPIFRPIARPARWRGPRQETKESTNQQYNIESPQQSNQHGRPVRNEEGTDCNQISESRNFELRFSFTVDADQTPRAYQRNKTLNRSFSELQVAGHKPFVTTETRQTMKQTPYIPDLTKPKQKQEGYGFSYSDTFWCDSDEYPDTECDWDDDDQEPQPRAGQSTSINKKEQQWKSADQTPQASFAGSTFVDPGFSFDDAVVLRSIGSFHPARPERILPCTKATREDTVRLKAQAKALLDKYTESSNIQTQLLTRLERMVSTEQRKNGQNGQILVLATTRCAVRLQEFLFKIKEERVETGEHRLLVEHEFDWVKWLVEASRTEVMHFRTAGCRCRPDWKEGG